jgi:hypothetical protein
MNCPFCENELYKEGHKYIGNDGWYSKYTCSSIACMVNNDFPRYKILVSELDHSIEEQEYAIEDFYVKVSEHGSHIYKLISCMLNDEVSIARPIWLNPTNFEETLDKLKIMVMFS